MSDAALASLREIFSSRLETLSEILGKAEAHFGDESFLGRRLAPDMLPFGTQIAHTCDQALNFALFCQGKEAVHLDPTVGTLAQARDCLAQARSALQVPGGDDASLAGMRRVDIGPEYYCELSGSQFVHDVLLPNFYFHLVTAYDILRGAGVALGKADFMRHLGPHIRRR